MTTRLASPDDQPEVAKLLTELWGSTQIVSGGISYNAATLPAILAFSGQTISGLATLHFDGDSCQLVTLNALRPRHGVGSLLLGEAVSLARSTKCKRFWLVTTNDNLAAIRFYQRRGFRLAAVHPGAVDEARTLKPSIPVIGHHGIPLHDEVEFEFAGELDSTTD